jgi:riboflavin kinase / FMN adenylyltransferase
VHVVSDVRSTSEVFPHLVLTVGSFDGVHCGHLRIIELLVEAARERSGTAALMTLRPHPRHFFSPEHAPNLLTSEAQQEEFLAAAGVDALYVLPFDESVARLSPTDFLHKIILGRCHAEKLIVGHDFTFGKNAEGNYALLEDAAAHHKLELHEEPPMVLQGERVSSTLIRERILQGELEGLEVFLGRRYAIRGIVEKGRGMGRKLGYPTANVIPHGDVLPANGVYAAEVWVNGKAHRAAVNIGVAPTIAHDRTVVEAHLLDFDAELNGQSIDISFHYRLRPEKAFPSLEKLVAAIDEDVRIIRDYFREL